MIDETTGREGASKENQTLGGTTPPAPTGAPIIGAPVPEAPRDPNSLHTDIATILKDVKLPEKRDVALTGERAQPSPQVKDIDALLSGSSPTQTPGASEMTPPQESAVPAPAPQKDSVRALHTFKHDIDDVVRDQKISVVKAAAMEQEKERPPVFATATRQNRMKNTVFAALVLLILGAAALGGVYFVMQSKAAPLPAQDTSSLVFSEQTASLPIGSETPAQLKGLLADARYSSTASLGSITRIAPVVVTTTEEGETQRFATLSEFLTGIGANPPQGLIRALSSEFFFGLHTVDVNAPLLVIPVTSYDRAFAGMLEWEPSINQDLSPVYTAVPDLIAGSDGIPQKRVFSDVVMRNYDVRALKDDSGNVVMYYSFPTRNLLVIAESPYTFTELLSRLQAQNRL